MPGKVWESAGEYVSALVYDILANSEREHYRTLASSPRARILAEFHTTLSDCAWLDVSLGDPTPADSDVESSPLVGDRFGSDGRRYAALFHWATGDFLLQLDSDVPGESPEDISRWLVAETLS